MNQIVVVGFNRLEDARAALGRLRDLEKRDQIHFEDTALIERDADGTTHVKNEMSGATETGAVIGAAIGGLMTFMFPVAGMAIGAAAGGAIGAAVGRGVSHEFIDEVKTTLTPGRSALFLVVKSGNADPVLAALRDFRGDVIQTTLAEEDEAALREALGRPDPAPRG